MDKKSGDKRVRNLMSWILRCFVIFAVYGFIDCDRKLRFEDNFIVKYNLMSIKIDQKPLLFSELKKELRRDSFDIVVVPPAENGLLFYVAWKKGRIVQTRGINIRIWVNKKGFVEKIIAERQISVL